MSVRRKWLLGIGASLLGLMLMIAAFSVGVHVGERGLAGQKPPAGRAAPMAPDPGQRDQAPPPDVPLQDDRVPVLRGVLRGVRQDLITLQTGEGPRLVQVSSDTIVLLRGNGERSGSLEDLKVGVGVAVVGRLDPDTRMLTAATIVVLLPREGR
jgi:hypothetical protein